MQRVVLLALCVTAGVAHAEPAPAERARKLVEAQLAVILDGNDDRVRALFAPDAVVAGYRLDETGKDIDGFYFTARMVGGSPHSLIRKHKITSIAAGGDARRMWITVELALTVRGHEPEQRPVTTHEIVRLTELVVHDGQAWKIVAAMYDQPGAPGEDLNPSAAPEAIAGATAAGPIAALLTAPSKSAAALGADPGTFVIGTERRERGVGPAGARKLLRRWSKLSLSIDGTPREVRTATWGFAQAHVTWQRSGKRYRMFALAIAVPGPDGSWTPVALHYAP